VSIPEPRLVWRTDPSSHRNPHGPPEPTLS
jgi:hypothetical protein